MNPNLQLAGLDINQDSAGGRVGAYGPPHRRDDTGSNSGRSDSGRRSKNSDYRQNEEYNGGGRGRGYVIFVSCTWLMIFLQRVVDLILEENLSDQVPFLKFEMVLQNFNVYIKSK